MNFLFIIFLGNEVHPKRPAVPPPGLMGPAPSEPPTAFVHFGYGPPHQPPPTAPIAWVCQTAGSNDANSSPLISRQSSPSMFKIKQIMKKKSGLY